MCDGSHHLLVFQSCHVILVPMAVHACTTEGSSVQVPPVVAPSPAETEPAEEVVWHVDEDNCVLGAVPRSRMVSPFSVLHTVFAFPNECIVVTRDSERRSCGIVQLTSSSSMQRGNCMCNGEQCARITVQVSWRHPYYQLLWVEWLYPCCRLL